jgi:hypothetical protein
MPRRTWLDSKIDVFLEELRRVRQPDQDRSFFYSPGVTEPATIGPHDAPPHAGQVVRRVLLRRNIVIDAETARLVAAAVQAALEVGTQSRSPRRGSACSRRRLRAAVLITAHARAGDRPPLVDYSILAIMEHRS